MTVDTFITAAMLTERRHTAAATVTKHLRHFAVMTDPSLVYGRAPALVDVEYMQSSSHRRQPRPTRQQQYP